MNLADINRLFDYMEWANELAIEAAAKLPEEDLRRDFGISHGSIFGTLVHMAGAEWIWVERWHGHSPTKAEALGEWTIESCPNLAALNDRWGAVTDKRRSFVSGLDEERLAAEVGFKLLSTDPSCMKLVDQMQHVVNHATMHRGQI